MTQKEVIEGNKILMKFLELNNINTEYDEGNIAYGKTGDGLSFNACKDYNDLMRVWFKFLEIDLYRFDLCYRDKLIMFKEKIGVLILYNTIDKSFKMLVKAIEYYNSIKQYEQN